MTKVDEAIIEIQAALADMASAHEGLRDFARLDLRPGTQAAVTDAIGQYARRKAALEVALAGLQALVSDTYPVLDIPDVSLTALADLEENARTVRAALEQFRSMPAVALGLTAGDPEPK